MYGFLMCNGIVTEVLLFCLVISGLHFGCPLSFLGMYIFLQIVDISGS